MRDLLSRFQVLEANQLMSPSQCAVCGCISGKFVTWGLQLEFFGNVYLCLDVCIVGAARELGFVTRDQLDITLNANKELRNQVDKLTEENEELRNAVGVINRISAPVGISSSDNVVSVQELEQPNKESSEGSGGTTKREAKSSGSNDESGSSDILDDDSLAEYLDI